MEGSGQSWSINADMASSYGEIGRAVIEVATRQANAAGGSGSEFDATVTVRLKRGGAGTDQRYPEVCCICMIEDGVVICRGWCCEPE
jgi:hypothetical protein